MGLNPTKIPEEWRVLDEFPKYEISNLGRIARSRDDFIVAPSKTQHGDLKVRLYLDQYETRTRLLKVLVAETFVPRLDDIFDTPILIDGNPENVIAANITWRPRWYAWKYTRQFTEPQPEEYKRGPIVELDDDGRIINIYDDIIEAGITHGLLFELIWKNIHQQEQVFPTGQQFAWAQKGYIMSIESERVKRIKQVWEEESRLSKSDVNFLIMRAEAADTMKAANDLRSTGRNPLSDLFGF